jgi:hypothetical protein
MPSEEMTMDGLSNLFADIPTVRPVERMQPLLSTLGLRIERIISLGHCSPEGFLYGENKGEGENQGDIGALTWKRCAGWRAAILGLYL